MTTSGHDAVARLRAAAESVTGVEEAAPLLRREARLDRARPAAPRPADALPAAAGPPAVAYGGDLPDDPGFPPPCRKPSAWPPNSPRSRASST